jgi:hypothetical protein
VSIEASPQPADAPRVEWVAASKFPYGKMTRRLVDGSRSRPILGESGKKLVDLIAWDPASRPPRPEGGLSDVSANLNLPASDE